MAFPVLPETSNMQIFASIVHHLRTNNINVYVSKIYPSGLMAYIREGQGAYIPGGGMFGMLIELDIQGHIFGEGGVIYGGHINGILRQFVLSMGAFHIFLWSLCSTKYLFLFIQNQLVGDLQNSCSTSVLNQLKLHIACESGLQLY